MKESSKVAWVIALVIFGIASIIVAIQNAQPIQWPSKYPAKATYYTPGDTIKGAGPGGRDIVVPGYTVTHWNDGTWTTEEDPNE